ncbi:MAG: hypothetical protein WAP55_02820 [Minisyncoccia bacterium]
MEIVPAILESDWPNVAEKIKLMDGLTDWIQLDISDGIFTPIQTWSNPQELLDLNIKSKVEVHLMVADPAEEIKRWAVGPVSRLVVPIESLKNVEHPMFNIGREVVLGFNIETPWEMHRDLIGQVGRVLFLSVRPGYQGQEFDGRVIDKIRSFKSAYPQIKIEVDGGIDLDIAKDLKEVGVDDIVVGSGIFASDDPKQAIQSYKFI